MILSYPVGQTVYTIEVAPGPLLDDDGRPVASKVCPLTHRILICPLIPQPHRMSVALAAFTRAWQFETGDWSPPLRMLRLDA